MKCGPKCNEALMLYISYIGDLNTVGNNALVLIVLGQHAIRPIFIHTWNVSQMHWGPNAILPYIGEPNAVAQMQLYYHYSAYIMSRLNEFIRPNCIRTWNLGLNAIWPQCYLTIYRRPKCSWPKYIIINSTRPICYQAQIDLYQKCGPKCNEALMLSHHI